MNPANRPFVRAAAGMIFAASTAVTGIFAPPVSAEIVRAVEYYHQAFEHYFVTANPAEIAALDSGMFQGWWRTGQRYRVDNAPMPGLEPVCRFYTAAYADKASHFFTASATECEHVKTMADWTYEGVAFYARAPDAQANCSAGTAAIHRLYNNGQGGAPNHAYTADDAKQSTLVGAGWVSEGVAYCTPLASGDPVAQTQVLIGSKWDFPWVEPLDGHDPVIRAQFSPQVPESTFDREREDDFMSSDFIFLQIRDSDVYVIGDSGSIGCWWGAAAWDPIAGSYLVASAWCASPGWSGKVLEPAWMFDDARGTSTSVCTLSPRLNLLGTQMHPFQQILYSGCQMGVAYRR